MITKEDTKKETVFNLCVMSESTGMNISELRFELEAFGVYASFEDINQTMEEIHLTPPIHFSELQAARVDVVYALCPTLATGFHYDS